MEKIICPNCKDKTIPKVKKIYDDDFHLKETMTLCPLCGAKLNNVDNISASNSAKKRLAALLDEPEVKKVTFEPLIDDGNFCLHCRHWIKHPFRAWCSLTTLEKEAMDSCDKFLKKENI